MSQGSPPFDPFGPPPPPDGPPAYAFPGVEPARAPFAPPYVPSPPFSNAVWGTPSEVQSPAQATQLPPWQNPPRAAAAASPPSTGEELPPISSPFSYPPPPNPYTIPQAGPMPAGRMPPAYPPYPPASPFGFAAPDTLLSDRSKVTAGALQLLAIFGLGGIGRLYLGYTTLGVLQLALGWATCGIWPIIDAFLIFSGKVPDVYGRPLRDGS